MNQTINVDDLIFIPRSNGNIQEVRVKAIKVIVEWFENGNKFIKEIAYDRLVDGNGNLLYDEKSKAINVDESDAKESELSDEENEVLIRISDHPLKSSVSNELATEAQNQSNVDEI